MPDPRPNLILLVTDDQGYGDLSCHGNPWLRTPELDRLHDDSVRLTDFHVDPMCAPTRAGLMTGRYSARTGVWSTLRGRYLMRREETTMAEVFAAAGYATGMFGKWHLGDTWPYRPHDRGFQETLTFGGGVVGELPDFWDNDYFNATYLRNGRPERFENRYCTDLWFDEALAFVERHHNEPFFCYLPTNVPHGPHDVEDRYSDPYLALSVPPQRAKFYGMLANLDENVGRLRRRLGELDLADNTILVFFGDNGTAGGCDVNRDGFLADGYNAGMRGKKCWAFEGGHRNACFIHWPAGGLKGGRDVSGLTSQLDLLPTFAELCGVPLPATPLEGRSLAPLLRGDQVDWPDHRVHFVHNQQIDTPEKYKDFQVMTSRWRLAQTKQWGPGRRELFDRHTDPGQQHDVAAAHPEVVEQLMTEYERWWDSVSERFDAVCPIYLGGEENPVKITAHAWHGKEGIYSQRHARQAVIDNGYWVVDVVQPGEYEFRLCRWPEEADTPIRAPLPARTGVPFVTDLPPGEALPIVSARLVVGDADETQSVDDADHAATFRVFLPAGRMKLETCFTDEDGAHCGAYYVYARRLGSASVAPSVRSVGSVGSVGSV